MRKTDIAFTDAIKLEILERISRGETVREIMAREGMPGRSTLFVELARDPLFAAAYSHAKDIQLDEMEDEILEIADDGRNDWVERQQPSGELTRVVDHEHIQRSRVRIDARKWLMAMRMPKKYGERVRSEVSGPDGQPLQIETTAVSEVEVGRRVAFVLSRANRALSKPDNGDPS